MDYDLFVIGAGSGGIRAARMAAQMGARVAVAEDKDLGGTCVNLGCVPKKLFWYASHFSEALHEAAGFGWQIDNAVFNWPALIENKDEQIAYLNDIYRKLLKDAGVELHETRARINAPNTVALAGGETITAEHILIATGSQPMRPDIPGAEHGVVSDDIFHLEAMPERIIIVGGGYIGVEFAGIFHGMGAEAILVHHNEMFLRGFDDDCRRFLAEQMQHQNVDIRFNCEVVRIEKHDRLQVILSDGREETVDAVLFATGRRPNSADMGLEELGVELTASGGILVDHQYSTAVPSVYAVGDVIHRLMLTPVALAEGAAVVRRLFGEGITQPDYELVPTCIFSQPNLASVGIDEHTARERGLQVSVYRHSFRPLQYSLGNNPQRCLVKLVVENSTDRVLGAFMVGPEAGETIQGFAVALTAGATKTHFDQTLGIHPTSAEEFVTLREPDEG